MNSIIPGHYLLIFTFNTYIDEYMDLCNEYNETSFCEKTIILFEKITMMWYFYTRYLNYYYRSIGKNLVFPRKLFLQAKEDNLINNADIWISFIDAKVIYHQCKNEAEQNELMQQMVIKYKDSVQSIYYNLNNEEKHDELKKYENILSKIDKDPLLLPNKNPIYSPNSLKITEKSYNILLNYFKANKAIRNIWINGSRAQNTSLYGSDIDLIFDCPVQYYEQVKIDLYNLDIPYYIDFKNIYIKHDVRSIKSSIRRGAQKIYCAKDFDCHWEDEQLNIGKPFVDIGKIIY